MLVVFQILVWFCKGQFEGQEVVGIRLNWDKTLHHLSTSCDCVRSGVLNCLTQSGLMGDKEELGITCALIPTSHPGVEIGDRHFPK